MGREIERKFLVVGEAWRKDSQGAVIRQGYLTTGPPASVRVRVMGEQGFLNIKQSTLAIDRAEFDYPIPAADAHDLLGQFCQGHLVEKVRHLVQWEGHTWEIDEFTGANAGLIVAEIELTAEDEAFARPPWLGEEVSADPRYLNANLVQHPYQDWR